MRNHFSWIVLAILVAFFPASLRSAEIKGKVVDVNGELVVIKVEGNLRPSVGDKVHITRLLASVNQQASVADAEVILLQDRVVVSKVVQKSAAVIREGYSATIASEHPLPQEPLAVKEPGKQGEPPRGPAINSVPRTAQRAVIKTEMTQLVTAIENFRSTIGAGRYPPDGANPTDTVQFLQAAFPRCPASNYPPQLTSGTLTPDVALVFWLGGAQDTSGTFVGFSANPQNPFDNSASRLSPSFAFQRAPLPSTAPTPNPRFNLATAPSGSPRAMVPPGVTKGTYNWYLYQYLPPDSQTGSAPYVYFKTVAGTRWDSSKVLLAGGNDGKNALSSTLSYDPDTRSFTASGPGSPASQSAAAGGGNDELSSRWRITDQAGPIEWELTPLGTGRYKAKQFGGISATGTAVLERNHLRIDWTMPGGGATGYFEFDLESGRIAGKGKSVSVTGLFAGTTYPASVTRIGDTNRPFGPTSSEPTKPIETKPIDIKPVDPKPEIEFSPRVATLTQQLQDPDAAARLHAAKSLGQMGSVAGVALRALAKSAEGDPDEDVRRVAAASAALIRAGHQNQAASAKSAIKLAAEANSLATEASALKNQAVELSKEVSEFAGSKEIPANRAKFEKSARALDGVLGQRAAKYRAAAAKLEEVAKIAPAEVVAKYLSMKARAFQKAAESDEAFRQANLVAFDKSIQTVEQFRAKFDAALEEGQKCSNEYQRLSADAEKLLAGHTAGSPIVNVHPRPQESPPAKEPVKLVANCIGMKLVLIPAGEFMMGSPKSDDDAGKDEKPQHRVRITRPFYLGAYHVTRGQFRKFVEADGYKTEAEKDGKGGVGCDPATGNFEQKPEYNWRNTRFAQTDEHPVVNVTWNDAVAFCRWLSRKEGNAYRLPTEAEWEYACRAGTTTRYWCGDDPEGLAKVANVADGTARAKFPKWQWPAIRASDGFVFTSPVGSFPPNAFGLYDMHGNAWQRCSDWYAPDYYAASPADDPKGPDSGADRLVRGGCCDSPAYDVRSAFRGRNPPDMRGCITGFRVARAP